MDLQNAGHWIVADFLDLALEVQYLVARTDFVQYFHLLELQEMTHLTNHVHLLSFSFPLLPPLLSFFRILVTHNSIWGLLFQTTKLISLPQNHNTKERLIP